MKSTNSSTLVYHPLTFKSITLPSQGKLILPLILNGPLTFFLLLKFFLRGSIFSQSPFESITLLLLLNDLLPRDCYLFTGLHIFLRLDYNRKCLPYFIFCLFIMFKFLFWRIAECIAFITHLYLLLF